MPVDEIGIYDADEETEALATWIDDDLAASGNRPGFIEGSRQPAGNGCPKIVYLVRWFRIRWGR